MHVGPWKFWNLLRVHQVSADLLHVHQKTDLHAAAAPRPRGMAGRAKIGVKVAITGFGEHQGQEWLSISSRSAGGS